MLQVGFEPTIRVFEQAKTVHARPRGHCDRLVRVISLSVIECRTKIKSILTVKLIIFVCVWAHNT
jgi:hypothetical protein